MQKVQFHHYYLIYKPPKDAVTRTQIEKEFTSLDCDKLHYSLWRVPHREIKKALTITREYNPLILKRSRELIHPHIDFNKGIYDLGSVALVAYRLSKEQKDKRVAILRALRKTPRIRIGQSLYIIPYLKTSKLEAYKGKVMLQDDLFVFLKKKGVDAHRLTFLKIVYPSSHKTFVKSMMDHETLTCQRLASSEKKLMVKINRAEGNDLPRLKKVLSAYKVKYKAVKGVILFLHYVMNIDLRSPLKKAYNSLILCRKMYNLKIAELTV